VSADPARAVGPLTPSSVPPLGPSPSRFIFTGSGSEYFRIWVVNLVLTVLTLGIYSAWAKVRRARYFWQNTRLEGHVFDYHGRPISILRGRIFALVLLAAYSWAFQFSTRAGLVTVAVLCAVGPWLFMRAQQFKLGNTSFRGLRFGFRAKSSEAYRVVLPVLVLWLSPAVLFAVFGEYRQPILIFSLLTVVFIPWMHHRLKAYQHGRATYGDRHFAFGRVTRHFYGVYVKGLIFVVLGAVLGGVGLGTAFYLLEMEAGIPGTIAKVIFGAGFALVTYVFAWPYLAARLQQVVWISTHLPGVSFWTECKAGTLFGIVFMNVALTLLTCGLYWPFGAVALARYRIGCMRVASIVPLDTFAAGLHAGSVTAAGDDALDSFGLDLGI